VHNRCVVKKAVLAFLVVVLTSCGAKVVEGAPAARLGTTANVSVVPQLVSFVAPRVGGGAVDATA
jgi:hypothetical protein